VRLLVVATKAPWPPVDGGRLLLLRMLQGLAAAGVRPTLVAPVQMAAAAASSRIAETVAALAPWCDAELVPVRPAGPWRNATTMLRAAGRGLPLSIARHTVPAVRRRVEAVLAAGRFDLVHAEQLQALPQALAPARARGLPVVLRAQNVESALWAAAGQGWLLAAEARRLAAWEGRAVAGVDATLALTAIDAAALRRLAAGGGPAEPSAAPGLAGAGSRAAKVLEVPAPFPSELPPGDAALDGAPAVVVLGSRGWRPNEDAVAWFADEIWPAVLRALPAARLHLFGLPPPRGAAASGSGSVTWHGAPADSAAAFARGSIHVVPLRFGSGVRMKVLEAWARGIPVVATAEGAAGLEARDGVDLLMARDAAGFAAALGRLHAVPALAAALVAGGRAALRARHDPALVARRLLAVYEELLAGRTTDPTEPSSAVLPGD
jgi:hypothetical protein